MLCETPFPVLSTFPLFCPLPSVLILPSPPPPPGPRGLPPQDVYSFDMTPIAEEVRKGETSTALVHVVPLGDLVTGEVQIKQLDLCTMKAEDQDFTAEFTLTPLPLPAAAADGTSSSSSAAAARACHAIVLWFDTEFSSRHCKEHPVMLSTSVRAPSTHWAQTILVLQEPVLLQPPSSPSSSSGSSAGGEGAAAAAPCLTGRLSMVRNSQLHRGFDISLEYRAELSDGRVVQHARLYSMNVQSGSD